MENIQNHTASSNRDNTCPYEVVRAALLALAVINNDNRERTLDQVLGLINLPNSLTGAASERNALLALDRLIQIIDDPNDIGNLAGTLVSRLRATGDPLLKATADTALSEYLGSRAAIAERIARFYTEPSYEKVLRDFQRRHTDPRPNLILQLLQSLGSTPERICDIGCGTSDLGLELGLAIADASETPNPLTYVTRLDIIPSIVEGEAEGFRKNNRVHVTNHCADFFKTWPIRDHSQDIVVLAEVLEHSFDPQWLLKEAKRVLRGNGLVIITVPNAWHWKKVLRFLFYQRLERTFLSDHIQHFSKRTLKELLRGEGFDIHLIDHFSLHSETPVLSDWEPAKSAQRRLHRTYSKMPGCAWNYLAIGRLRRTVENMDTTAIQVSGVIAFGRKLLHLSKDGAVQQAMSEAKCLMLRTLDQSRSHNLNSARTAECTLFRTLQHVISVCANTENKTVESWLDSIDHLGWSKSMQVWWEVNQKLDDSIADAEWKLVNDEATRVWG